MFRSRNRSSVFRQKPTFGGFGSTPSQSSPLGSSFQQTQLAFASSPFGSSSFGSSSQPSFGATSTPTFGSASTPAFGVASNPAFGTASTPAFGSTSTPTFGSTSSPAFGSTPIPLFGSTGSAFGVLSTPAFGLTATSAFGAPSTSLFGSSSTFGSASTPTFGSSSTPSFGASSTPSVSFNFTPPFGQSSSTFGSTPFRTTQSPFDAQSYSFGGQTTTPTFGSQTFGSNFGGQQGSRVVLYSATQEVDAGMQPAGKLDSISAMPAYMDKSHEELRWEDYQRGDEGGPNPSGQPTPGIGFYAPAPANPFGTTVTFGQPATNLSASTTPSNPFVPKTASFGTSAFATFSPSPFGSAFGSSSPNPFGAAISTTSLFGTPSISSSNTFGSSSSSSVFGGTTTSAFSSPSHFGSMGGLTSTFSSGLNFGNTQSTGLFQSSTPSLGQTPSPFGQQTGFQQTTPAFGSNLFSTPSTGFGGSLFSSSSSTLSTNAPMGFGQTAPSLSTPFQPSVPAQMSGAFNFSNCGQKQPAPSGGFDGPSNISSQGTFGQSAATQSNMVMQPAPVTNPYGTLPAMPQISIGRVGSAPSVQYGISSMPVEFISDDETAAAAPKADALFISRENPGSLRIRLLEYNTEKQSMPKDASANGNDFFSDGSVSNSSPSFSTNINMELKALRLNLIEESEKRKKAEKDLLYIHMQWQRIAAYLSQVGFSFPEIQHSGAEQLDLDPAEICQEIIVKRFVTEAIEMALARAETEVIMEAIIDSKNHEISQLRDRLQYYEAMNREMSERNQEAVEMCPALSRRLDSEELKDMGNEEYKKGNFAEAVALYDRAILSNPDKASYWSNKAAALTGLGKLIEAVAECREAIRIDPSYHRAHHRLGTLYLRLGEAERALHHYKLSRNEASSSDISRVHALQTHLPKCSEARRLKDWHAVLKEAQSAISAGADSAPQVFSFKAEALLMLRRHEEAEAALNGVLEFDIDASTKFFGAMKNAFTLIILAQVHMAAGRFEDALSVANKAARLDTSSEEAGAAVRKARVVATARATGNNLFKASKFKEACVAYGEGLDHDPNNAILMCNRAACRSKLGQWQKAIEDCNAALSVRPSYSKARLRRADCNAKLELWEASVRDYETLLEEMPEDEEIGKALRVAQAQFRKQQGEGV